MVGIGKNRISANGVVLISSLKHGSQKVTFQKSLFQKSASSAKIAGFQKLPTQQNLKNFRHKSSGKFRRFLEIILRKFPKISENFGVGFPVKLFRISPRETPII